MMYMEFLSKPKQELQTLSLEPRDIVVIGSAVEILREMKETLNRINLRLSELERKFEERIPEKALSENKFYNEIQDGNEMIEKIVKEIRDVTRPLIATKEKLTIVETKRIEKTIVLLKHHGKLNSYQLGQIMGLSRTRCNEYLKQMESIGLVEGEILGKEKYYKLKN